MSPLELVGDFDHLAKELRASRPMASAALRERVAALGPAEPAEPRWTFHRPSSRLVLGLAAAALLASLVAAGLTRNPGTRQLNASRPSVSHGAPTAGAQGSPDALRSGAEKTPAPVWGPLIVRRRRRGAAPALPGDAAPAGRERRVALERDQAGYEAGPVARRLCRPGAVRDARRQARQREGRAARPGSERAGGAGDAGRPRHDPATADRDPRRHPPGRPRVATDREARTATRDRHPGRGAGDSRALAHAPGQAPTAAAQRQPRADRPHPDDSARQGRARHQAGSTGHSTAQATCSCESCSSCSTRWSSPGRCFCSAPPGSPERGRRGGEPTPSLLENA